MFKKAMILVLGFLFIAPSPGGAAGRERDVCAEKEKAITRQLEFARQHGNVNRVRGLERALENVRAWCSQKGEQSEAELKVLEKQEEVWEREEELAEAVAEGGKPDKIRKYERKLEEARAELLEAERERDALY